MKTLEQKLTHHTVTEAGCWEWTRSRTPEGYGKVSHNGHRTTAHRWAYMAWIGQIPPGMVVMHKCDNPPCINPAHLQVGTKTDNMRDCVSKGRHKSGFVMTAHKRRGENSPTAKLTKAKVLWARRMKAQGMKQSDIARKLKMGESQISRIIRRLRWESV